MNAILLWHKVPTSWRSRGVRGMNPKKEEPTTHGPSAKKLDYIFLSVHWMKTNLPLKISKNITYEEIFLQWKKRN